MSERIANISERIARAATRSGNDPARVTLLAVSKRQPPAMIVAALEAGQPAFGESYVQEALAKTAEIAAARPGLPQPSFHLIGHLQRNKARAAATSFAILHAVDSEPLLDALASLGLNHPVTIMIQVNLAGEATKHGVSPEALPSMVSHARSLPGLDLRGLMTIPPPVGDPEDARPAFRQLRRLAEAHGLPELSMGMSDDFEVAVEEGATFVRVGRAIFGERP